MNEFTKKDEFTLQEKVINENYYEYDLDSLLINEKRQLEELKKTQDRIAESKKQGIKSRSEERAKLEIKKPEEPIPVIGASEEIE